MPLIRYSGETGGKYSFSFWGTRFLSHFDRYILRRSVRPLRQDRRRSPRTVDGSAAPHADRGPGKEAVEIVYSELHQIAAGQLRHERPGHTLQTTALVHEAYLRLVGA